jgi:hypothetical protein
VEWLPSLLSGLPGAGLPLEKLLQRVGALALKKVPEATYSLLTVLRSLRMLLEKDRPPRGY